MIAVTTPKRIGILPQIETVAESLPGFSFTVWGGLFAPKATPKPIIDQLNREINLLRTDISSGAPSLSSSTSKILKNAEDLNVQMFDLIRSVAEMAEKESKKKTPTD